MKEEDHILGLWYKKLRNIRKCKSLNLSWVVEMEEFLGCFMWCENIAQVKVREFDNGKTDDVVHDIVMGGKELR